MAAKEKVHDEVLVAKINEMIEAVNFLLAQFAGGPSQIEKIEG